MAPTIAITGSAGGIGAAIAKYYAAKGYNLVLADSAAALLKSTTETLQTAFPSIQILSQPTDVSKESELVALKDAALKKFATIDMVFLNAGISGNYKTEEHGWWGNPDGMRKLFDVNLFGVVNGISAFLPVLKAQAAASPSASPYRIIITGSKQGITNPPGNPAYNASKAAIRFLAEQLSYDLIGQNIKAHLLIPGWVFTGLAGGVPGVYVEKGTKPAGAWVPDQIAERLAEGLANEEFYILCPDNEVSIATDKIRMEWTAGDWITPRDPLSRWRKEYQDEWAEFLAARQK
ncbi:uncharacterized protein V1516DRAFT_651241 [Lipomyces oligophaga]|uniref:uncharacterized protein n=1 Tax=Lipomyces oligophaga TaxID=45792 RepID=UPI0034CEA384